MNSVLQISRLAKSDSSKAEDATLEFVREILPQLGAESVRIQQSKISLNSVNGQITTPGRKYFFKFHAEENESKELSEYYNTELLARWGIPVVQPLYTLNKLGSQFVVYPYIDSPTAFEEFEKQEMRYIETGSYNRFTVDGLLSAETELLEKVRDVFLQSLSYVNSSEVENARIHQLFYHRFCGSGGAPRLDLYYTGHDVAFRDGERIAFDGLKNMQWIINGVQYDETLDEIITGAKTVLKPDKEMSVPVVVGHGDDHNGNKFFIDGKFVLFDAAFAGQQPALLSFVKATAHNSLLHPFWLYDPRLLRGRLKLNVSLKDNTLIVDHNWNLLEQSPVRLEILKMQTEIIWRPLIQTLRQKGWLIPYWKEFLRKAFFACPFLVKNLIDSREYSTDHSIVCLSKCVELGSKGNRQNIFETFLGDIECE